MEEYTIEELQRLDLEEFIYKQACARLNVDKVDIEEKLERLYWVGFDKRRSSGQTERDSFKMTCRGLLEEIILDLAKANNL
jgi:hypothetical protein